MKKFIASITLAVVVLFSLAACAPAAIEMTTDTVVVDVRTADEYIAGHLDGAINIDVRAADFDTKIGELPKDGRYVVYCASGNRSASAVSRMADLGFTNLVDAGGMPSASTSTGLAVVTTG